MQSASVEKLFRSSCLNLGPVVSHLPRRDRNLMYSTCTFDIIDVPCFQANVWYQAMVYSWVLIETIWLKVPSPKGFYLRHIPLSIHRVGWGFPSLYCGCGMLAFGAMGAWSLLSGGIIDSGSWGSVMRFGMGGMSCACWAINPRLSPIDPLKWLDQVNFWFGPCYLSCGKVFLHLHKSRVFGRFLGNNGTKWRVQKGSCSGALQWFHKTAFPCPLTKRTFLTGWNVFALNQALNSLKDIWN